MSRAQRVMVVPVAVIAAALLVSAVTGLARLAAPVRGATHQVSIENFAFMPANLTVAVGDTVTWTNNDDAPHTATASNGAFDSGTLDNGGTFSFTFTTAGTYAYICEIHPQMTGTITVQAPAATAAPATATASAVPNTATEAPPTLTGSLGTMGLGLLLAAASAVLVLRTRRAR